MNRLHFVALLGMSVSAVAARYDLAAVRDASTLETKTLEDWRPSTRDKSIRTKLLEITVCEWWPGQKVRIPVTFNAPLEGVCSNIVVMNMGLGSRPATPRADELELLKQHGVGFVMIGMGTIDAMQPVGQLHLGMKRQLLKTRDPRFTPAWIWGMSQMRGLTAALAETNVFRTGKVLSTGGSKRGVATAAAGIHDDRFTAILPVVAPPLGNPGGPVVIGTEPPRHKRADEEFYRQLTAGKLGLDLEAKTALQDRATRRTAERVTLDEARTAGWSAREITDMTAKAWDVCRVTDHLPSLHRRGLEVFYCVGANDSVTPALRELGLRYPDFPIYIVPGGQHGGPANAGYTRRVPLSPDVRENFVSFALHHFFGTRSLPPSPTVAQTWNARQNTLSVTVSLPDGVASIENTLWWSIDRSEPFTLFFEYDQWEQKPMTADGQGKWSAEIKLAEPPGQLDILTVHKTIENDLPITVSSPYLRAVDNLKP